MKLEGRTLIRRVATACLLALLACGLVPELEARPGRRSSQTRTAKAKPSRTGKGRTAKGTRKGKVAHQPVRAQGTPIVNARALSPFFQALQGLDGATDIRRVRILHFGDSHTAADHWTGRIRQRLQARYGDGGPGFITTGRPWRGYSHDGARLLAGFKWPAQGLRSATTDGIVGLAGVRMAPLAEEPFRLRSTFSDFQVHVLGEGQPVVQLTPVQPPPEGGETTATMGGPRSVEPTSPLAAQVNLGLRFDAQPKGQVLRYFGPTAPMDRALRELSLTVPEGTALLGVELFSGQRGVIYDELGLNGAEMTDLQRWSPELRQALLARTRPDLVVLAYGTNETGHPAFDPEAYETQVTALLKQLKLESGAPILVIGPLDRSHAKKGPRRILEAQTAEVLLALRHATKAADCAFWDARQAMGGQGAVVRWRKGGLAQKDLVHLTGPGYQKLGDAFVDALYIAMGR